MRFCVSKWSTLLTAAVVASSITSLAQAATVTDTSLVSPPGVYFGNGNAGTNVHWTVNTQGTVELGLTAIQRTAGATITPAGNVYNVNLGSDTTQPNVNRAWWNFDFSINLRSTGVNNSTLTLAAVTPTLTIFDVAHGTSVSLNPLLVGTGFGDDNGAYQADGGTRNGNGGSQATGSDVGAQNSENLTFGQFSALGFDMNLNDTYLLTLSLVQTDGGASLGSVAITVVAGTGAPLPAALPLFATGLGALGFVARRRKRKAAATA